jgi:hypothetical protein
LVQYIKNTTIDNKRMQHCGEGVVIREGEGEKKRIRK